jgi:hypothetical protein
VGEIVRREEAPLCALPADEVKEQFGTEGLAILVILGRLMGDRMRGRGSGQPIEITEESGIKSASAARRSEVGASRNCGEISHLASDGGTEGQLDNRGRKTRYGDNSLKLRGNAATKIPGDARRNIGLTRDNRGEIRQLKFGYSQDETALAAVVSRLSAAAHPCRPNGGYGMPQLR